MHYHDVVCACLCLRIPFGDVRPSDVQSVMEEADQQEGQCELQNYSPAPNGGSHSLEQPVVEPTIHQDEQIKKNMKTTHDKFDEQTIYQQNFKQGEDGGGGQRR